MEATYLELGSGFRVAYSGISSRERLRGTGGVQGVLQGIPLG